MTNNRRKRKLTSRQASIISWVITAVNFICVFVNGIILKLQSGIGGYVVF